MILELDTKVVQKDFAQILSDILNRKILANGIGF